MAKRSVEQMIEEQVQRWQLMQAEPKKEEPVPVITISREAGSGGRLVAQGLAEKLGLDLFHQEVIHEMAESAKVSDRLLETLDEKGLNVLENWISSLVDDRHLWPDQYLRHLLKIVGAIGKHGQAVMVGRGANFVLPPEKRFRVRVVAPLKVRVQNVSRDFGVSVEEANRRVIRTDSDRKAFIRKYFHADITNPLNYDLVINTGTISIEAAVNAVAKVLEK
ncbi:AAA family ATPase [Desulfonema magnum]|uniref:Cytidylate kinase-like family protein n=1 Tax=Desulfonema magnum TaxID=45655 RepID=A0A975BMJ2_9BACT|nr:cytidylate kinase-like family protein [Desulfonema magnum]QTA88261.1 Cytidylate kinase-like family protein [Desulfonema magnum]